MQNQNKLLKKEKNKFAKLSNQHLTESIALFSNGNASQFASSEFKVLSSKSAKQQNNNHSTKEKSKPNKKAPVAISQVPQAVKPAKSQKQKSLSVNKPAKVNFRKKYYKT